MEGIFTTSQFWTTFLTLAFLEIVLGIDNVIFHSLTISNLPAEHQQKARVVGMSLALGCRFLLLWSLVWFMGLTKASVPVGAGSISARDLVLFCGGAFLLVKSVLELCLQASESPRERKVSKPQISMRSCILQIIVLDLVFSLDSVITAVGMANDLRVIMLAILVSMAIMMRFSAEVSKFLNTQRRIRALAFLFIAFVGGAFVAEAFGQEVPKVYIYALAGMALLVELVRMKLTKPALPKVVKKAQPKFNFTSCQSASLSESPAAMKSSADTSSGACTECGLQKRDYWFCVHCGSGLGVVSMRLGEVKY